MACHGVAWRGVACRGVAWDGMVWRVCPYEDVFSFGKRDELKLVFHGHHRRLGNQDVDSTFNRVP